MRIFYTLLVFSFCIMSCTSDVIGVVLENDIYSYRVTQIINDHEETKSDFLEKYLNEDSFIEYSGEMFNGKQNLIKVWKSEFYFFSNVFFDNKEVFTTFNKDRSYTTIFKGNWSAKGNFTNNTYKVYSFYEFKWKYNKICEIHVHWNNEPYYKEWNKLMKSKEYE